ncbi:amino acid ABC transporter permease [Castellaniella sp. GW247-6E4]|uniref:amino acid ABC transporter permease n=1 Tax=Castellaniella sp. GW247-6E4 TaxID=3140380 RepID=UPI003314F16A
MDMFTQTHLEIILQGAGWTVLLSCIAMIGGGALGLLIALCNISKSRALRLLSGAYIQLVQGTPLLVIMFLSFFGLSIVGWNLPAIVAASLSLSLYTGAHLGEIWRGCIQSVPKSQWEAAECLALSRYTRMRQVILPQALRIATPPTVGFIVQLVKNSSLASVIGFVELVRAGQLVNNTIFEPGIIYFLVAALYFLTCYPLSVFSRKLERKLHVGRR